MKLDINLDGLVATSARGLDKCFQSFICEEMVTVNDIHFPST